MSIAVGSARYRALVNRARQDLLTEQQSRFDLGDIALELAPMGSDHTNSGAMQVLSTFAHDVGLEVETLRHYRMVAAAWPDGTRGPSVSWSVYRELSGYDNRFDLIRDGMTVDQVRRKIGRKPTRYNEPEDAAHVVRSSLQSPEVADQVMSDPDMAETLMQAAARVSGHSPEQVRARRDANPMLARSDALLAEEELRGACARFSMTVRHAVERMDIRPGESRDDLLDALRRVQVHADWAMSVVQGGRVNLDDEIRRLIEGGTK